MNIPKILIAELLLMVKNIEAEQVMCRFWPNPIERQSIQSSSPAQTVATIYTQAEIHYETMSVAHCFLWTLYYEINFILYRLVAPYTNIRRI